MRTLSVGDHTFPLLDTDAYQLHRHGIIYPCNDPAHSHDFHLDPKYEDDAPDTDSNPWGAEEVLLAIGRAQEKWEADHTLPTQTLSLSAVFPAEVVKSISEEVLERRKDFTARNLALNIATSAAKGGLLEQSEVLNDDGSITLSASFTVVPPKKKGQFSAISRLYVISLIDSLTGVSDQRKDDAISLIKMLK